MRASAGGLVASRKELRPAFWYIAMLSGMSFSQPSTPWIIFPQSPLCWKPVASSRRWWSSMMISARRPISL